MPLYEFRCDECGDFDQWRTMAECQAAAHCPQCQKVAKRLFSPPALLSSVLRLKRENPEPQLVKRKQQESARINSHAGGRPWMIGH